MKTINTIIAGLAILMFTAAGQQMKSHQRQTDSVKTAKETNKQGVRKSVTYSCPMHPEVVSDKPGKCPKCKMDLVKSNEEPVSVSKTFTCPMHPEVKSDKPGKCPRCKMNLVLSKKGI
jgi:Cu+-exporting ATPase